MTHQNHQTNGASLEDCHTNFFALTDLCGIKWRKFNGVERPNTSVDPLEDPILRSYSRCLDMNILCVWRRVESPRQDPDPNSTGGIFESMTTVHPPLSLTAAKELWIFWYGEEPELSGAVDSQLLKQGDSGMNSGAWESGLSYECRSLLFKALHIIIERSLLAKGFVRLGKWFVQPCTGNDNILGKSSQRLSISFVFFVHGDTVCASIDLREHSAVKLLTPEYLAEAAAATSQQQQQQQSSHINTTSPLLSASLQHGSASAAAASIASSDVQQKQVILAPYGMSAILTGNSIKHGDAAADKLLEDWGLFYPLCNTDNSDIPPVVEVISGGYKMSYPSKFVLVTELDDSSTNSPNMSSNQTDTNSSDATSPLNKSGICAPPLPSSTNLSSPNNKSRISPKKSFKDLKTLSKYENSNYNNFNNHNNINTHAPLSVAIELPERVWQDCITHPIKSAAAAAATNASNVEQQSPVLPPTSSSSSSSSISSSTSTTTSANVVVKQEPLDGIMNPDDIKTEPGLENNTNQDTTNNSTTTTVSNSANSDNLSSNHNNNNNNDSADSKQLWDFVDPTRKTTCICARFKKTQTSSGGSLFRPSSSSSLSTTSTTSTSSSTTSLANNSKLSGSSINNNSNNLLLSSVVVGGGCGVGNNNNSSSSSNYVKFPTTSTARSKCTMPFHKREFVPNTKPIRQTTSTSALALSSTTKPQLPLTAATHTPPTSSSTLQKLFLNQHQKLKYLLDNNNTSSSTTSTTSTIIGANFVDNIPNRRSTNPLTAGTTPHGGGSSYSRNSIGDLMTVPSVGSPGSAAASPHPNSQLSQPSSVPPVDQLMSPRPPPSVPTNLQQPNTPLEHLLDKNTPAPTPTDQHDNKSITASPYIHQNPSIEAPLSQEPPMQQTQTLTQVSTASVNSVTAGDTIPLTANIKVEPGLNSDEQPQMEQPQSQPQPQQITEQQPQQPQINQSQQMNPLAVITSSNNIMSSTEIGKNLLEQFKPPKLLRKDFGCEEEEDNSTDGLLYDYTMTEAWMAHPVKRFKPNDLKKPQPRAQMKNLYDSHSHHKPVLPSPNSFYKTAHDNQIKRDIENSAYATTTNLLGNTTSSAMNNTEHYTCEMDLKTSMHDLDNMDLLDNSHNSPAPADDLMVNANNVGGGLLLGHKTPPESAAGRTNGITEVLPSDTKKLYNHSNNTNTIRPEDLQKMFPTPPSHEPHPNSSPCGNNMDMSMSEMTEIHQIKIKQEPLVEMNFNVLHAPVLENKAVSSVSFELHEECTYVYQPATACTFLSSDKYSPTMLPSASLPALPSPPKYKPVWQQRSKRTKVLQQITPPPSNSTNNTPQQQQQLQQQQQQNHIRQQRENRPPSSNLLLNQLNCPPASMRVNMPTISPAMGSPMMHRKTPIHPPPPYEQAISSPATSTSSYLNRQYHSMEQPETPIHSSLSIRLPETNALLVNVLLYDTALNIFRDHNFDSCTLCVCNAIDNQKCVGNIRGSDSGLYVALPGTSYNPSHNSNSQNNMRSLSAYGETPTINHLAGYNDDDPIRCSCGFSAVINRRLSHRSGLFYEDEMEITGIAEDPAKYKQKSIITLFDNGGMTEDQKAQLAQVLMDLLRDECTSIQTSSSSIHRALSRYQSAANRRKSAKSLLSSKKGLSKVLNILEFTDANDIICLAIENGKIYFNHHSQMGHQTNISLITKSTISVHKWPFVQADGTKNNQDIVRVMKSLQMILQNAFQMKSRQGQKDAAYAVTGPLTWRQFHRLAGRASGLCEPQPIPALIVGHEKDWLSVAPYAIHYWDKLLLEPYSYSKDIAYVVVCPDNDDVLTSSKMYFKELSTTYDMCRLGRHSPMTKWNSFLAVNSGSILPNQQRTSLDDWFDSLPDRRFGEQLKLYAHALMSQLAPYLSKIPNDKTILYPGDLANGNPTIIKGTGGNTGPNIGAPTSPLSQDSMNVDIKPVISPKQEPGTESNNSTVTNEPPIPTSNAAATVLHDPMSEEDDINPPIIVVYLVEPFTCGNDSPDVQRVACLALLRSFSEMLNTLPDSIRGIVNIQIVSLESVMELGRNRRRERFSDEMKCLALSIFSKCKRNLAHSNNVKSLTGFGTAANIEQFLKSKDDKNRIPYKMFTPAYILAPIHEKSDKTDLFRIQQQYPVMYCNYCISEDQSWLLATATDDRGELLEKIVINIDIPNRTRRKKTPARRYALQKLMDFILGIISQTVHPWRLVIGRIGRIGHGEMKSWSWLLSKQNLQKMSKQLKEMCKQCSILYPLQVPSILSACLVTLEPDSKLRVMPDQFTPDERFSRISMQNPLSTPQDVTCTHILVFPTSAVCQSFQKAFNELNEPNDNDFNLVDGFEDDENMTDMNLEFGENTFDIFGDMNNEPNINDNDQMNFQRNFQNDCDNNFNANSNRMDQQEEEVGTVLQQPLAVGYFVSTAPTGRMPAWFWSSCPHLEDVCPVFLKTALHLHVSGIQQNTDDPLVQNQSSGCDHPLDSQLTADVLRYVLEGYNVLSWLALDSNTHDRLSCLPLHVQVLMQLYHMTAAMA